MVIKQKITEFLVSIEESLTEGTFVKLSLGNYKGTEESLKKILVKRVLIKRDEKLSFTYQYKTRDITKNYSREEGLAHIGAGLETGFNTASLSTTEFNLNYESFNNKAFLKKSVADISVAPSLDHDKNKKRLISSAGKSYLHDLKITDEQGNVYKNAQDKFRQINKYIEILASLIKNMETGKVLKVVDMGSGKGYLTFALYDYLKQELNLSAQVTGVEYREDMVSLCNQVAGNSGFDGLNFVQGTIESFTDQDIDLLIALHACDTATDDAIYKGIQAGAQLIVVAPCCHKQIRREIEKNKSDNDLDFITRHGILLERQAEMVTDSLRALLLEYAGYSTKIFEFISGEHTAKNVMIVAEKNTKVKKSNPKILEQIKGAKKYFGIGSHHLEEIMKL